LRARNSSKSIRMVEVSVVSISERSAASKERRPRLGPADKPASDACFNDWKRFCFVLREIAGGENGRALSGLEAQERARAVLVECGYTWPGRALVHSPIVAHPAAPESPHLQAPVDPARPSAKTKRKSVAKAQSASGHRRNNPPRNEHRVGASTSNIPRKTRRTQVPYALGNQ
jgi:hypothetical protein